MKHFHLNLILGATLAVAAQAQSTATVGGRVNNAVDGQPVQRAIVVLQGLEPTGDPPQADSYVVETDANGRFHVDDVAPGRYEAKPRREGFTAQPAGVAVTAKTYPRFTVEAGQQVRDINLRLFPLGTISGRAVDPDGDPVSGAFVEALRHSYAEGKKQLKVVSYSRANDRGEYRIPGLAPGRYYVRASPPFSLPLPLRVRGPKIQQNFLTTYFPAASDPAGAVSLDLPPGSEVPGIHIQLRLESSYTIRLTIAGSRNEPSAPYVSITPISDGGPAISSTLSGGYGRMFRFPAVPGTYLVGGGDKAQGLRAQQLVKVVDSDVEITLTLRPEVSISGTVHVEGGARIALDGVRVSLEADELGIKLNASVKPDGTFAVQAVQPVVHRLRVAIPPGGYLKSVRLGERKLPTPEMDMAQASGALTITIGGDGGKLDGVVMDAQGVPPEGAVLVLVPDDRLRDWADLMRSTVTGKEGKFDLRDIAPGGYKISAWEDVEPGAPLDPDFRKPFEKQATAIRVAPDGRDTLELKAISVAASR